MKDNEVVKAVKEHINRQGNNWKFIMGREVLTKKTFLKKLDKDKKFRKMVVRLVYNLSIDILTRKGSNDCSQM